MKHDCAPVRYREGEPYPYIAVGADEEAVNTELDRLRRIEEATRDVLEECFIQAFDTENFSSANRVPMGMRTRAQKAVAALRAALGGDV